MKKLIAALLTAALMTLGLVAATGSPSTAKAPYPVKKVNISIRGLYHAKHGATVTIVVSMTAGAKGKLSISVSGPGGYSLSPSQTTFNIAHVKRGAYHIRAHFTGTPGTAHSTGWKSAYAYHTLKVS